MRSSVVINKIPEALLRRHIQKSRARFPYQISYSSSHIFPLIYSFLLFLLCIRFTSIFFPLSLCVLCETRYIGIYLTAVMAITSISVVMTVIVLNCHYKGPTAKQVPRWMRRYVITGCGRLPPLFLPSLSVRHTRSVARIPCLLVGAETSGMDDDELRRRRRKMMNYLSFLSIATNRFDESLASFSDLDICSDRLAGATIIRNARRRITRLSKKWRLQRRRRRLRPLSYRPAVVWATDVDSKAPRPAAPPVARISLRPSLCRAAQPAATTVWPTRPLLPSRLSR